MSTWRNDTLETGAQLSTHPHIQMRFFTYRRSLEYSLTFLEQCVVHFIVSNQTLMRIIRGSYGYYSIIIRLTRNAVGTMS